MKKSSLILGLFTLFMVNAQVAFAADEGAEVSPTEKKTTAEVTVTKSAGIVDPEDPEEPIGPGIGKGDFTINGVSNFKFGQIKMGAVGKAEVDAGKKLGLEVVDERGTGAGWNVQVAMTNFSSTVEGNSDSIVKGWELAIPKGTVTSKLGDMTNAPETQAVTLNIANTNQTIFSAGKDKGLGRYTNIFMDETTTEVNNSVRLSIPVFAKIGQYKAELTWSLVNGPTK
ncbi:hypothetical protein IGJ02_002195 [Enterococcus sp. DIV0724b]|uniref:WxL domain-containing protein n=1 Tax=Enterococcus sp. DIV0724b TaxID=2774694 RepID=UPI003D2FEA32